MNREEKIFGIYFANIQDTTQLNYVKRLHYSAKEQGYKIIIFNGFCETDEVIVEAKKLGISVFRYDKYEVPDVFSAVWKEDNNFFAEEDRGTEVEDGMQKLESNADFVFDWIDRVLEINSINELYAIFEENLPENSYVCLSEEFLNRIGQAVIRPKQVWSEELEHWGAEDAIYILNAIRIGDEVCGYYAVKTADINRIQEIKTVLNVIQVSCKVAIKYFGQAKIGMRTYTNTLTGLPNFRGSVKWFKEFCSIPENKEKTLTVSVYAMPKYMYIYENYGIDDLEEAVRFVARTLKNVNDTKCFVGHINEDTFVIVNYYDDPKDISDTINRATSIFFSLMNSYNRLSDKEYYVEVNCGCTMVEPNWKEPLERFIKLARNEMYINNMKMEAVSATKEYVAPKEHYKVFELLIERNLFHYHFQPIVSARTGEIYAYEALMRTDARIGMNPLEVLDVAKIYKRLYDIEKATLFNVMARYVEKQEEFRHRKVFINTIPGYFLCDEDIHILSERYGKFMDRFVYELTEQNTVSDEELNSIKKLCGQETRSQIAIDDYGTGHSNIVNLLRYAPQVIKVDRMLITDIHKNENKQMFMRSTIEFARKNNIKVLAEGVETSNELRMVINLGVDFIQGYYTGRPELEPLAVIPEDIRKEIEEANTLFCQR